MVKAWHHQREGSELLRLSDDGRFTIRRLANKSRNGIFSYRYEATDHVKPAVEEDGTLQAVKRWCDKRA